MVATQIVTLRYPSPRSPDVVNIVVGEDDPNPFKTLKAIAEEVDRRYGSLPWAHWTWDGTLSNGDSNVQTRSPAADFR